MAVRSDEFVRISPGVSLVFLGGIIFCVTTVFSVGVFLGTTRMHAYHQGYPEGAALDASGSSGTSRGLVSHRSARAPAAAPALRGSTVTPVSAVILPSTPDAWAAFDGDTYYTLDARQRGGFTDDAAEFTLLAWVYLDPVTSASTQTVSSTKKSACSARGGSALLINSWLTQDGCLRAEWSTEGGTCGELSTPASAVAAGQWVHVGYSLLGGVSGPGKAFLYLHGQLIGAGTIPAGRLLQAGGAESQLRVGMQLD
ncbi:MAG: hypothetical protein P4L40_04080, partial [Terracidiphilus sp.]|nr:hypothetical protein [Terracidiphilus sp.]